MESLRQFGENLHLQWNVESSNPWTWYLSFIKIFFYFSQYFTVFYVESFSVFHDLFLGIWCGLCSCKRHHLLNFNFPLQVYRNTIDFCKLTFCLNSRIISEFICRFFPYIYMYMHTCIVLLYELFESFISWFFNLCFSFPFLASLY